MDKTKRREFTLFWCLGSIGSRELWFDKSVRVALGKTGGCSRQQGKNKVSYRYDRLNDKTSRDANIALEKKNEGKRVEWILEKNE